MKNSSAPMVTTKLYGFGGTPAGKSRDTLAGKSRDTPAGKAATLLPGKVAIQKKRLPMFGFCVTLKQSKQKILCLNSMAEAEADRFGQISQIKSVQTRKEM